MDATVVDLAIRTFLREARERIEEAAATAKAAEACAAAGKPDRGVEIANVIDEPIPTGLNDAKAVWILPTD